MSRQRILQIKNNNNNNNNNNDKNKNNNNNNNKECKQSQWSTNSQSTRARHCANKTIQVFNANNFARFASFTGDAANTPRTAGSVFDHYCSQKRRPFIWLLLWSAIIWPLLWSAMVKSTLWPLPRGFDDFLVACWPQLLMYGPKILESHTLCCCLLTAASAWASKIVAPESIRSNQIGRVKSIARLWRLNRLRDCRAWID